MYGSLRPGKENAHVLEGLEGEWARGWVRGRLRQIGWGAALGYPALTLDETADPVEGDLLTSRLLPEHWDRIDRFEGRQYQRVMASVTLVDGSSQEAFVYVLRDEPGR